MKIYGKVNCVYCQKAKDFLDQVGVDYTYIDLGTNPEALEFILQQGHKSVPQIYDGETYVGGYAALVTYLDTKKT